MKMSANAKNFVESMTRRRVSCPQATQQLWDAIKSIRNTRQVPTSERIQKIMQKEFGVNESEVTRQLGHCVRDGLLEVTKRTVSKGNNAGSEQEWYKLPAIKLKTDEYDWYCFDCHQAGDVICCSKSTCQRVYHLACISNSELPQDSFICHVCRMCQKTPSKFQMKRSKLNRLLGHPLAKLKSKYPLMLKDQRFPAPNKNILVSDRVAQALTPPSIPVLDESEAWRPYLIIAREMNLTIVEEKIDRHRYRLLEEFHADCLNILHNMVIYNGVDSAVAVIARQMLRDCVEDLQEIRQCVDCYKMSHGNKKQWFAKPCRKPHELVYAKQSGMPYWPAKVMKIDGDQYDVRLFGAQHTRVVVAKSLTRPISVNIHTLQVKRSSNWNRACEELKRHQELLEKARIETRNFTKFIESSSSEESESMDSETERKMERELRNARVKGFIEKQTVTTQKQKTKRRRSSSTVPPPEKKRGRPKLADTPTPSKVNSTPKPVGRPGRKRKETYDSSDSMDSFHVTEASPKKNTEEIFNELLKSSPTAPPSNLNNGADLKDSKKAEPTKRAPRKTATRAAKPIIDKRMDFSEESKMKSDTLDSSTMSSFDTDTTSRRKPQSFSSKKFSSSDDSDSDGDSDLASSSSNRRKTLARKRPVRPKKTESRAQKAKNNATLSDDSTSTDSDSDLPKKSTDKSKTNGKDDDSSSISSDTDDDSIKAPPHRNSAQKVPVKSTPATTKPKPVSKPKHSESSDSESVASVKANRSKAKDTPESTDVDTPPPTKTQTKPLARRTTTPSTASKSKSKPVAPKRTSERNKPNAKKPDAKTTEKVDEDEDDDDDSSDSETPLSNRKPNVNVRNILKKYSTTDAAKVSSDSDTKIDSDSDSDSDDDDDDDDGSEKKSKVKIEKVDVPKDSKEKVDDKKVGRGKKSEVKEEQKEKEETVVSSSSQEPVTRAVAVQTEGFGRVANLPPDLKHRAERIAELEKELQIQAQTNRLLEMEFDKTKVLIERMRSDHDDEIAELRGRHASQVSEIKKKQWCYNCESEAIYHCCWNTAYCSVECQQAHWQSEHKRVCRRKRNEDSNGSNNLGVK